MNIAVQYFYLDIICSLLNKVLWPHLSFKARSYFGVNYGPLNCDSQYYRLLTILVFLIAYTSTPTFVSLFHPNSKLASFEFPYPSRNICPRTKRKNAQYLTITDRFKRGPLLTCDHDPVAQRGHGFTEHDSTEWGRIFWLFSWSVITWLHCDESTVVYELSSSCTRQATFLRRDPIPQEDEHALQGPTWNLNHMWKR